MPELMGHVAIPYKWKEFLIHRRCSFDVSSIKEGRQTIFFTPLDPLGGNPDEEELGDDLSRPRKRHYYSK